MNVSGRLFIASVCVIWLAQVTSIHIVIGIWNVVLVSLSCLGGVVTHRLASVAESRGVLAAMCSAHVGHEHSAAWARLYIAFQEVTPKQFTMTGTRCLSIFVGLSGT